MVSFSPYNAPENPADQSFLLPRDWVARSTFYLLENLCQHPLGVKILLSNCAPPGIILSRQPDLTFPHLIAFLLSGVRGAVQAELDAFFALLERRSRLCRVITASAFSKARSHLFANAFDPLNWPKPASTKTP